jgi:ankyrin repeat protein
MDRSKEFLAAVMAGDTTTVAARLAEDPALAAPGGDDGTDPVALAARHSRLEVLRLLLEAGATTAAARNGREAPTALMRAAAAGAADAVALLLQHGADPALRDAEGRTAADLADAAGHHDLARRLAPDADAERIIR